MTVATPILKLGSRGSPLALVQAKSVAAALTAASADTVAVEIITFTTKGDQLTSERLTEAGGKGLFTREIDAALTAGAIDVAVHSLKDVPVNLPEGQIFAAYPKREDAREGFVSDIAARLEDLPDGATIGTASLRREAQTRYLRPDLNIVTFRGNVATRLSKLRDGQADATYLALAGLSRLGMSHVAHPVALEDMLPAAAQGILGIVVREDMPDELQAIVRALNDARSAAAAIAERAFLAGLDGNCRTPIAAHLFRDDDAWRLEGEVLLPDGSDRWRVSGSAPKSATHAELAALGQALAETLRRDVGDLLPAFGPD